MQTAITEFIRKRVEETITDAVGKRAATMFAEKMRFEDKPKANQAGNRAGEPPLGIVIPEED